MGSILPIGGTVMSTHAHSGNTADAPRPPLYRWECPCRRPPVLLATFDLRGRIQIANEDRYWQADGRIATNCPKCGKQHLLQARIDPGVIAALPRPWRD
jgi:hypothetical protein